MKFAMTLSLVVGTCMLGMKMGAYLLTNSAAILSDAAESVVHVLAVAFAFYSLHLALKPADDTHLYGHAKISFFSAGFEGGMIVLAALYIIYESIHKWVHGLRLENVGVGVFLTLAAALINGALGAYLIHTGRRRRSLILVANGKHVLTDFWTSLGAVAGLGLAGWTGWLPWDPICGILMAGNILWSGGGLIHAACTGLMDQADPTVQSQLRAILDRETNSRGLSYHQLRHRNVGDALWVEVHLVFPQDVTVAEAHRQATAIESAIEHAVASRAYVTTHLESSCDHDQIHPNEREAAPPHPKPKPIPEPIPPQRADPTAPSP